MAIPLIIQTDITVPERQLNAAKRAVSSPYLAEFLETLAHQSILERLKNRFASEGDDASGPWAPLTDATASFRKSQGFPEYHPINVRTGGFRDWILGDRPDVRLLGLGGASYTFPGGTLGHGQDIDEKFTTAQKGRTSPSTPARPVVAINARDTVEVTALLTGFISSVMIGVHP